MRSEGEFVNGTLKGKGAFYFNDGSSFPDEGISQRHNIGATLGAIGGHVNYIKYKRYYELAGTEDKDVVGGFIPINNELRICWLVQESLGKVNSPTERVKLIEDALKQTVGLHTAAELVKVLGRNLASSP